MSYNETTTEDVEIHSVVRLPPSASGIPRWTLHTNKGSWTTQTNAPFNRKVESLQDPNQDARCVIGKPGRTVTLIHTRSNEVVGLIYRGFHHR